MEIKKIKLKEKWWSNGASGERFSEREYIEESELEKLNEGIKTLVFSSLPEKGNVFFEKSAIFPRTSFREKYPNHKIVNDIQKADIIICNPDLKDYKLYNSLYHLIPHSINGEDGYNQLSWSEVHNNLKSYPNHIKIPILYKLNMVERCRIENFELYFSKKLVLSTSLSQSSMGRITDENIQSIKSLFESNNEDNINMAMKMLTVFDFDADKFKIAMLMSTVMPYWQRSKKSMTVEVKAFLKKLNANFPNIYGYNASKDWILAFLDYVQPMIQNGEKDIKKYLI